MLTDVKSHPLPESMLGIGTMSLFDAFVFPLVAKQRFLRGSFLSSLLLRCFQMLTGEARCRVFIQIDIGCLNLRRRRVIRQFVNRFTGTAALWRLFLAD